MRLRSVARWTVMMSAIGMLTAARVNAAEAQHGDQMLSMRVDGRERTYLLHLPPTYDGKRPLPLVIVLHGGGGNAQNAARMTGFSAKADKEGFVVVYPNGTGRLTNRLLTWNSGNCCGYALDHEIDDVKFIGALVDRLIRDRHIDPHRVYATGMSNGGMMAYRLGCELSDKIAAIAPVSGALNLENCQSSSPVSVIVFHGTLDEHVLYNGGAPRKGADRHPRVDKSVAYAMSFWAMRDGCTPTPQRVENGDIIRDIYGGGKEGTEVVLYTIKGGGHAWPGGQKGYALGDEPTQSISATDLMWDFFMRHPKP